MIYLKAILALIIVACLILLIGYAFRRVEGLKRLTHFHKTNRQLTIQEQCFLDAKHRLVIVARGKQSHLLLLSPQSGSLVESWGDDELSLEGGSHAKF